MTWTKKDTLLVTTTLAGIFLVVNLIAQNFLTKTYGVSIYDPGYEAFRSRFVKVTHRAHAHPFYGLADGGLRGIDSKLSAENSFAKISPIPQEKPINVLVLGGSVAGHLSLRTSPEVADYLLSKTLNAHFNTNRFVVYNAAFGGGKQPQQYFKLLYLDLLGFDPDLIINYDGFNEVALTHGENFGRNLNAIYPRQYDETIFSTATDGECIPKSNQLLTSNSFIPVVELARWAVVMRCHREVTGNGRRIAFTNPELVSIEKTEYVQRVKNIWAESSNKIFEFANRNKTPYIHVLQPNQYLPNSKPLSSKELADFYKPGPYKAAVENYYQEFDIDDLAAQHKLDQRTLLQKETRTVYADSCCHFNQLGMHLIISDLIIQFSDVFKALLEADNRENLKPT